MTIWQRIKTALASLHKPMAQNVWIAATGAERPNEYLVYSLITGVPEQHADDVEKSRSYHVQISYYNRNGLAGMPGIATAMVSAGFTRGPDRELSYDELTRHFGLALEFYFYEE